MELEYQEAREQLDLIAAELYERLHKTGQNPSLDDEIFSTDWFNQMAIRLFKAQMFTNPTYKKWIEANLGERWELDSWWKIPPLSVRAFAATTVSSLRPHEQLYCFVSSGTTGMPRARHFHSPQSLRLYECSLWPPFRVHLLPSSEPPPSLAISLTPPPEKMPHSSLIHMIGTLYSRLSIEKYFVATLVGDERWTVDTNQLSTLLEFACNRNAPVLLIGTAFSWVQVLEELTRCTRKFLLPAGSRIMETGGYKGRSKEIPRLELYAWLQERLGVPLSHIISEYGMCELSSQAYDHTAGAQRPVHERHFRFPPWVRIRVISPETGEDLPPGTKGLLAVYDLANVYSVAALVTEDVAIKIDERSFVLLGRSLGATPRGCSLFAV